MRLLFLASLGTQPVAPLRMKYLKCSLDVASDIVEREPSAASSDIVIIAAKYCDAWIPRMEVAATSQHTARGRAAARSTVSRIVSDVRLRTRRFVLKVKTADYADPHLR